MKLLFSLGLKSCQCAKHRVVSANACAFLHIFLFGVSHLIELRLNLFAALSEQSVKQKKITYR